MPEAQKRNARKTKPMRPADVYSALRSRILTLEYRPGTRLVEDTISSNLNAGRTPVREALLRLHGEGLVSRDNGWVIRDIGPEGIPALFECRIAIEGYATRLAALRASEQDTAELQSLVERMDEFASIPRIALNRLNRAFHEKIVEIAGNPMFVEMHSRTMFHYWNMRSPVQFSHEQTSKANEQHRQILAAIRQKQPEVAEALARAHVETTYTVVRDVIGL
ncbi:MAG: GntR family transcriptional regulator [Steroidobacteraceae bacterium]